MDLAPATVSQPPVTPELISINTPFVLFCNCSVTYHGRGISTLQTGNYLIIHKSDGAFLVHGSTLAPPLNYQKQGAKLYRQPSGGVLISQSKHETVNVQINYIYWMHPMRLWSDRKIEITRTEKEIVSKLHAKLSQYIPSVEFRETRREAMTTAGPADLLAVDATGTYHVFEAKRAVISINAVHQLYKYLLALRADNCKCVGYVVAPTIGPKALEYAAKYDIKYLRVAHDI